MERALSTARLSIRAHPQATAQQASASRSTTVQYIIASQQCSPRSARQTLRATLLAILGVSSLPQTTAAAPPLPKTLTPRAPSTGTVLARNGEGPFPYYRIIALTHLGSGVLLASYDDRPFGSDSPSPNSILQRRSTDGGATWGPPSYIAKGQPGGDGVQQYGFSDPSYVADREKGKVFNFHVFLKDEGFRVGGIGNDDKASDVISAQVSASVGQGVSWYTASENQELPLVAVMGPGAPPLFTRAVKPVGKTVGGVAKAGGVLGTSASTIIQPDDSHTIQAYSVYSDDHGSNWTMSSPIGTGMDENEVVELSTGDLMLNLRPWFPENIHLERWRGDVVGA